MSAQGKLKGDSDDYANRQCIEDMKKLSKAFYVSRASCVKSKMCPQERRDLCCNATRSGQSTGIGPNVSHFTVAKKKSGTLSV